MQVSGEDFKSLIIPEPVKEGEAMAYRVAIVDDSVTDARFVEGILTDWAGEYIAVIQG